MIRAFSQWKVTPLPVLLTFIYIIVLSIVNGIIALRVFLDPSPFPASHWDMRWAVIFAAGFLAVGLLSLLSQHKILQSITLVGVGILVVLPVFTIGAAPAYLVFLLLAHIAYGAGEHALRLVLGIKMQPGLERSALAVLIGFGFIAILVMIQGMLFAFTAMVTWLGLAVLALLFVLTNLKRWLAELREQFSGPRKMWSSDSRFGGAFVLSILTIMWIPSWFIALAPANRYDELTYHLAAPAFYLRSGGIVPYPEGGMSYWMHYADMLYTLALQTAGQPLPRILHLFMGVVSVLLVFLFGKRLVNTRIGLIAAVLFAAVPAIGYEAATAYIDLFVTAYTTAFGFCLLLAWQERNPRWLVAAGVLGGIGIGIKLTAGPMIAALLVVFLLAVLAQRRFPKYLTSVFAMAGLILALALPWLIRDMLWTGDPFYPYGAQLLSKITGAGNPGASSDASSTSWLVLSYFHYPFDLVFNSYLYYREGPGGFASALPLLAIPLFAFLPSLSRQVKFTGIALFAANAVTLAIMILVNNGLLRYAFPMFPWLAICAALNIGGLYQWLSEKENRYGMILLGLVVFGYVYSTRLPLIVRQHDNIPQRYAVNYLLGRESREAYLSRTLVVYDAFRFIDSQPGSPHRVLSIGNEFRLYTDARIDGVYDTPEAHAIAANAQSPADLAHSMERRGYDYVLLNQPEVDFVTWKYVDPYPVLQDLEFWNTYGELVFVDNGVYVYRFAPGGAELPSAVNLLSNNGFEEIDGEADFVDWDEHGAVEVSTEAFQGNSAVLLHAPLSDKGFGDIIQRVPIQEESLYTLGYWLRADPSAVFLMRVYWLDINEQIISTEEQWRNIDDHWKWYSIYFQAPPGARFAEVHASLGNTNHAWVDEICFTVGQQCPAVQDE